MSFEVPVVAVRSNKIQDLSQQHVTPILQALCHCAELEGYTKLEILSALSVALSCFAQTLSASKEIASTSESNFHCMKADDNRYCDFDKIQTREH